MARTKCAIQYNNNNKNNQNNKVEQSKVTKLEYKYKYSDYLVEKILSYC